MGRLSQLIWFINSDTLPTKDEELCRYSHLTIDSNLKKFRTEYRKSIKKLDKDGEE